MSRALIKQITQRAYKSAAGTWNLSWALGELRERNAEEKGKTGGEGGIEQARLLPQQKGLHIPPS